MPSTKNAASKRADQAATDSVWSERLRYFEGRQEAMVETIREFVAIESPSDNKLAADRMGALLAVRFEALGGRAHVHRADEFADHVRIDFPGREKIKPVLLLGHFDA